MHNNIIKEINREYEMERRESQALLEERKEELYLNIPRLKEIDRELTNLGIDITKGIFNNDLDIDKLKEKQRDLINEKQNLIKSKDFPSDYLDGVYTCDICKDTGFVDNQRCKCYNQKLMKRFFTLSNLNNNIYNENFDTFDFKYYSDTIIPDEGVSPKDNMKIIYERALNFVKDFDSDYSNLLFYGGVGLGKTFLCNSIAKEILEDGKTVLYKTAGHLFRVIEDARFNRDEMEFPQQKLDFIYNADLLIIDDLGTEFDTLATHTAFFNIINDRILNKKPIIISTNLSLGELENKYTERLMSRIIGNFQISKFFGKDIRMIKKYNV